LKQNQILIIITFQLLRTLLPEYKIIGKKIKTKKYITITMTTTTIEALKMHTMSGKENLPQTL